VNKQEQRGLKNKTGTIICNGVNAASDDVKLLIKSIKRWPFKLWLVRLLCRLVSISGWIMEIDSVGKGSVKIKINFRYNIGRICISKQSSM